MWGNGKKTLATLLSAIMIAGTILQTSAGAGENIKNKQRKVALDDVMVTAEKQEM